uniref:Ovule protein n=1 Tax=Steinernema glaseri TaxID=37863 RepID=A0A1I7ZS49_9BILA
MESSAESPTNEAAAEKKQCLMTLLLCPSTLSKTSSHSFAHGCCTSLANYIELRAQRLTPLMHKAVVVSHKKSLKSSH